MKRAPFFLSICLADLKKKSLGDHSIFSIESPYAGNDSGESIRQLFLGGAGITE